MRKIAVINQKGGVGKTTTAVNLSAALAECGKRVCVMDLDPQAHASLHLGMSVVDNQINIYDVLCGDAMIADARRWVTPNLAVVPANLDLAAAELELAGEGRTRSDTARQTGTGRRTVRLLDPRLPSVAGRADPQRTDQRRRSILAIAPHFLALHGLSKLLRTIEIVAKRLNPGLRLSGVVLCMYESSTRLAAEVTRDVEDFLIAQSVGSTVWAGARFFESKIRRNIAWPKHLVSVNRSSTTRRPPMARKTIASWLKSFWRSLTASPSNDI